MRTDAADAREGVRWCPSSIPAPEWHCCSRHTWQLAHAGSVRHWHGADVPQAAAAVLTYGGKHLQAGTTRRDVPIAASVRCSRV